MSLKQNVFFILGSGGHTAQILLLQKDFSDELYEKHFIIGTDDILSEKKVQRLGYKNVYFVERYKRTEETLLKACIRNLLFLQIIRQLIQSVRVVKKMNKDLVITAGPNLGIFVFIFAKMRGNFCVFIESWSRRKKLSKSGKLLKYFSNQFFVQWEEMQNIDSSFLYEGRMA